MTAHDPALGGRPVGQVAQLDAIEACLVIYLRLWSTGPDGQLAVRNDLINGLGPARGAAALAACDRLFTLLTGQPCRRLHRHAVGCPCLGADEACFARFVATAATQNREDALWIAIGLVRPDIAPSLTQAASDFGLRLRQMLVGHAPVARPPVVLH